MILWCLLGFWSNKLTCQVAFSWKRVEVYLKHIACQAKLCHFRSSGIFKLQINGWHCGTPKVIFGLSAQENIKKHQQIKIKKQDHKFVAKWYRYFCVCNFVLRHTDLIVSRIVTSHHQEKCQIAKSDLDTYCKFFYMTGGELHGCIDLSTNKMPDYLITQNCKNIQSSDYETKPEFTLL